MRKYILILLIILCFVFVTGCNNSDKDKQNNNNQNENVDNNDKNNKGNEKIGEEIPKVPEEITLVSNKNQYTFDTNISVEDDIVIQNYQLDQQIQNELESGYTFADPMVIINPFGISPLTAVVIFETEDEVSVRVTVEGNSDETDVVGTVDANTRHRVPVIGLYPAKENEVTIELLDKNGEVRDTKKLLIQTDDLPKSMKNIVEVEKYTKKSAYGLIEVSGFGTPHPFAFDTEGIIRWYLTGDYASYGYFPLSNGRFMVMDKDIMIPTYEKPHAQQMYEMDFLGRVHQIYLVKNGIHHEIIEKTPGGNLLISSNSIDEHVEDTVVEIDRNTGEILKTLDMREIFGETYVDMMDWAHVNAVSYVEQDDSIVASPRNVHSGIKVDWTTNELKWILCNPKFWEGIPYEDKVLQPVGDITWPYQPHSIYQVSEDLDGDPNTIHIMMFDNHWQATRKAKFWDKLESSFVTIYNVNEKNMTVSQHRIYEGIKSKITSNYRFNYEAGRVFSMGGYLAEETADGKNGMIYEFDYDTEEMLNQYSLRETFYRAYEFVPDFNTCAVPMELPEVYFKGTLKAPVAATPGLKVPGKVLQEGVNLSISNQILYVGAKDHQVSHVEFIGGKNYYVFDLSHTGKGEEKYHKLTYKIMVPFSNLTPDEYQVVINFEDTRYDTGKTITIK